MRPIGRLVPVILGVALAILSFAPRAARAQQWNYPPARREPVTDDYFGTKITDDYRWLENVADPGVQTWLHSQADLTSGVLERIPGRDSLMADFVRLDALRPATIAQVTYKGGRWFYKKTLPAENVGKLYYRDGLTGAETLLFDPTEGAGGTSVSLNFYATTEDGRKVALGVSKQGSESATIRILNVDDRTFLPETIAPCWQGVGGWTKDGKGFTYSLMNSNDVHDKDRELNTATRYHALGTDPKDDPVILSVAKYPSLGMKAEDIPQVSFSDDFRWIFGAASTVRNELTVFVAPASELLSPAIPWKPLLKPADDVVGMVEHGDMLYLRSHRDAPRYRILAMSLEHPDVNAAKVILPQGASTITALSRTKDDLLVTTSDGIDAALTCVPFATGKPAPVALPGRGSLVASGYGAETNGAQVVLASWTRPSQRFELDAAKVALAPSPLDVPAQYPGLDDIAVDELAAKAQDGTMIPLTVIHEKSVPLDGNASCYLSGYGAYGISRNPTFSTMNLALVQRGVTVAVAHVRGGGEKGFEWYHGGYKATKPNTWNDFIACAQYLVDHKYTSPPKLFGEGTSAGGILIGRAITERPDLFGAAICNVPCANALRLENTPNGPVNTPEFGSVQDAAGFHALYEMDAFQHVKEGVKYPAVICVGGFNDPRVIVWQPAKMAAALQHATASGKPVLLQVNYDNGHFTEDKKVAFRNFANMYAFCLWQTGNPQFRMSMPN